MLDADTPMVDHTPGKEPFNVFQLHAGGCPVRGRAWTGGIFQRLREVASDFRGGF